jgi:hypothetical protein
MPDIRPAVVSDFATILGLNDAEVQQTSAMDGARLESLVAMSAYCRVATVDAQVVAFIIALREDAPYVNDNFAWFASRFERFLYVDRIVVCKSFAGRRIGSALYDKLFEFARRHGVDTITCEVNIVPPNPISRAFHSKYGFEELGTQWLDGGSKQVSLQAAESATPKK